MSTRYQGRIAVRVSPRNGDLDLIGEDRVTFIAVVGRGLDGEEFERARCDAQHIVNCWNAAQEGESSNG